MNTILAVLVLVGIVIVVSLVQAAFKTNRQLNEIQDNVIKGFNLRPCPKCSRTLGKENLIQIEEGRHCFKCACGLSAKDALSPVLAAEAWNDVQS